MADDFTAADSADDTEPRVKRDRYGRYLLPDPKPGTAKKNLPWTRATTLAKSISDSFALTGWQLRMVAKGLTVRPDLYALAAATPVDDRDTMDGIVSQAKDAAESRAASNMGTALHAFSEQVDQGLSPIMPPACAKDIAAYTAALQLDGVEVMPEYIERIVVCPDYSVAGTLDRILRLTRETTVQFEGGPVIVLPAGTLVIGDLKTGKNAVKYGAGDISIQLSLYGNATHMWNPESESYEPMPEVDRRVAIVIHLPAGTATCQLVAIDIEKGWAATKLCADVREWRKDKTLAVPLAAGSAVAPEKRSRRKAPAAPDYAARVAAAQTREELSAIYREAAPRKAWTPALAEAGAARLAALEAAAGTAAAS